MDVVIRPVKSSDARQFITLHNLVWRSAYYGILPEEVFEKREELTEQKIQNFTTTMLNTNNQIVYVAEHNGKLVGLMFGVLKSEYKYFNKPEYADMQALYIHPEYQNKGIATKLKNVFITWAKNNGKTKFVVGVLKENTKAQIVYKKWGGKQEEFINQFIICGKGYDEIFFTYNLIGLS